MNLDSERVKFEIYLQIPASPKPTEKIHSIDERS